LDALMGKFHDLVDFTQRFKGHEHAFYLDAASWRGFTSPVALHWQRVRFGEATRNQVPQVRGLYVFTLEVTDIGLPSHGYIMYVGETGNTSAATLRSRYGQYLRDLAKQDGRPAVYYMMENWRDDLFFNFVEIPDSTIDVKAIQNGFIDAVIPPVNKRDMDAKIMAGKAAAF
jgi:hypothetical protein